MTERNEMAFIFTRTVPGIPYHSFPPLLRKVDGVLRVEEENAVKYSAKIYRYCGS